MSYMDKASTSPFKRLTAPVTAAISTVYMLAKLLVSPHKAAFANLRSIPLTVAGVACIDYASFHLGSGWGWLVTGISLMIVEAMIADDA